MKNIIAYQFQEYAAFGSLGARTVSVLIQCDVVINKCVNNMYSETILPSFFQESPSGDGSEKEENENKDKELTSLDCSAEMDSDNDDRIHSASPDDDIIADSDDDIDVESETARM